MACLIIRLRSRIAHPRAADLLDLQHSVVFNKSGNKLLFSIKAFHLVGGFHMGDEYSSFGRISML